MVDGQLLPHLPSLLSTDLFQNYTMLPKRHPTSHFTERPLHPDTPDLDEVHSTRVPLRTQTSKTAHEARAAASWLPSQESPPTTTHEPGQIYCPFRRWCFDGNVEASVRKQCEQWLEGAVLSGGNHVPLPNANENPTTPHQTQTTTETISKRDALAKEDQLS